MDSNSIEIPLIVNNNNIANTEPPPSPYAVLKPQKVNIRNCCCFHFAYYPEAKIRLCNHWIFSPLKPVIITFFYILFYASAIYQIYKFSKGMPGQTYGYVLIGIISLVFLFLLVSYYSIIVRGPGYLPYNYSYTHQKDLNWKEVINTFAIYKEQADFAKAADRPARSVFSVTARRFILRADHYCLWTESWIGLNNYRYFLLMTFYAFLFSVLYICSLHWWAIYFFINNKSDIRKAQNIFGIIVPIIISLFLIVAACMAAFYFLRAFRNLAANVTGIELYKGNKRGDSPFDKKSCIKNFSEVCGAEFLCPIWWIPIFCLKPLENGLYIGYKPDIERVS